MTRYLKLSALAAAGLALYGEARAAVVYFPGENIAIPNTYAGVSVDLETGNSSTALDGLAGGDANFFLGGSRVSNDAYAPSTAASWQPIRVGTGNTDAIQQLAPGTTIDLSSSSYSSGFGASGQINSHMSGGTGFTDGTQGYLGFSLIIDDPAPGNPLLVYGWALVTFQDNDGEGTLHAWAYEDTGSAIQVGAVPEPTGGVLVLCGAVLGLLRRRR
jgi:hypothetical protein